mmetsp:Transcript_30949/g.46960  ORF Transcript_30949/g.46960 Transcript_30949/m.46960 type:complete len:227 (+) Transcript_30949:87-767(+)
MKFGSVVTLITLTCASAWTIPSKGSIKTAASAVSRRDAWVQSISTATLLLTTTTNNPALAAVPSVDELQRLQKGHSRVSYLLKNWDSLTQQCNTKAMSDTEAKQVIRTEGGGGGFGCEKTPLVVQEYMGYKSVNDPLYKIDKLLVRAAPLASDDVDYLDLVESYREFADNSAMMAYTSSWGEANPNGSKETIDNYLDQTKIDVVKAEKMLRKLLQYLDLPVLDPSK